MSTAPPLALYDEEARRIRAVCDRLTQQANARSVFVVDKNGYLLACAGDTERLDSTALASLVAGEIAATGGLAELLGEREFSTFLHEGVNENIHITVVASWLIVVVIFDRRSNLGYVRLHVKKCSEELGSIYEAMVRRSQTGSHRAMLNEITDDDIDTLFSF
jgi:predicted regulator of Ras-like GTPase activity (Roadblock/LC7/MglB family)